MPKVSPGYSGGRLPGRSSEEKGRKEGEEDEGSGERRVRNAIIEEVIKGIHKMAVDESIENEGEKTGGPDFMQSWDCSQIENEEEEESWREGDQMAAQWDEEQKKRRKFWNEEGWKEAPDSWRSCKRHRSWCMNACHKAKG